MSQSPAAGYSGKPAWRKLGLAPALRILIDIKVRAIDAAWSIRSGCGGELHADKGSGRPH